MAFDHDALAKAISALTPWHQHAAADRILQQRRP
jgi:hypothetical protein